MLVEQHSQMKPPFPVFATDMSDLEDEIDHTLSKINAFFLRSKVLMLSCLKAILMEKKR